LDVEAPGLHYKLGRATDADSKPAMSGGAVPYLVATAKGAKNAPPLQEHMAKLALPEGTEGWLQLMPAGPAPRPEYWTALKQLRERLRFDEPGGKGLAALLDLHARIEDELKPEYLLIDSRTGVTELGGLATTALADCVVCLLVPNQESVDGTLAIVEALKASSKQTGRDSIRIVPVVARTTDDLASEGRLSDGIKRLVEAGEGRSTGSNKKPEPFVLPHDSAIGATDKIVGGDRKASAFSPLHKAYLELFQNLFPQARKEAEEVLCRIEAVAELRGRLTDRRQRRFRSNGGGAFELWEDSAIEEGVVIKKDSKTSRYADLVCRGAFCFVEYIPESMESEVLEFWSEQSKTRCLILLCRKNAWTETKIYCRSDHWGEKLKRTQRYDPPAPLEFEIYKDPGHQSVDEILGALHRGNENLVPELVAQWQECMALTDEPKRHHGRWRPGEARRILDGLAATENMEVAVRILRQAAQFSARRSDFDDFEMRHGGRVLAALTAEELFAPLLWRLPVEAAFRYLSQPGDVGWSPCLTGHRLLAEDVMGLRYDPVRSALKDVDLLTAQIPEEKAEGEDEDERILHRIYRRLFYDKPFRLSEDPPSLLLWDQKLRKDRYWSGDLDDLDRETHERTKKLMTEATQLRTWLRGRISGNGLVTGGLLGRYDPASGRVDLYPAILDALGPLLGLEPRYLKNIAFIQLSVWAMAHQAHDCDGQPGFGFAVASAASPFQRESPAHVALTQYFAFRLIERLGDVSLMGAFEKLSEKQPEPYRRWRCMRRIPVERMRTALLRARLGEAALGLPGSELD
jgi:hypothetical protein